MAADPLNGNIYSPGSILPVAPSNAAASILFVFSRRGGERFQLPASDRGLCGRVHAGRLRLRRIREPLCGPKQRRIDRQVHGLHPGHPVPQRGFSSTAPAPPFPTSPASSMTVTATCSCVRHRAPHPAGRVWKVNCTTGATTLWTSGFRRGSKWRGRQLQLPRRHQHRPAGQSLDDAHQQPQYLGLRSGTNQRNRGPNPPIFPPASQCRGFQPRHLGEAPGDFDPGHVASGAQVRAPLHAHPDGHGHLLTHPAAWLRHGGQPGGREPD